ncbi:MAG: hypothetical protein ACKVOH_00925 [Chlamydiales bacterium]
MEVSITLFPSWAFGEMNCEEQSEIEHDTQVPTKEPLKSPSGREYQLQRQPSNSFLTKTCQDCLDNTNTPRRETGSVFSKTPPKHQETLLKKTERLALCLQEIAKPKGKEERLQVFFTLSAQGRNISQEKSVPTPREKGESLPQEMFQDTIPEHKPCFSAKQSIPKKEFGVMMRTAYFVTLQLKGHVQVQTPRPLDPKQKKDALEQKANVIRQKEQWYAHLYKTPHNYLEREKEREQRQHREQEEEESSSVTPVEKRILWDRKVTYQASPANRGNKPVLRRPRMGIFAIYYLLTKLGLISDGCSHQETRENIRLNAEETEKTHKKRLEELKETIKKEKSTKRWSVSTKIFSWFTTFMGIITGLALIASGVGVVAGAMLLTAGLLTLSNQILQLTGAWQKIAEKLPSDDPAKKRAIILWMQIGITVLALILSGAGIVCGGHTQVFEAMNASSMLMGGVIIMAYGTTSIGEGVSSYQYCNHTAKMREHMVKLAHLKHKREDLQEKAEYSVTRIEQLFEDLAKALEFEIDLFRADQSIMKG